MKYNNFGLNDFLNDDSFIRWVLYGEDDQLWKKISESNPSKQELIAEARRLVLQVHEHEGTSSSLNIQPKNVWNRIEAALEEEPKEERSTPWYQIIPFSFVKWAAVIALLIGFGWWMRQPKNSYEKITYEELISSVEDKNSLVERVNTSTTPLRIRLEDGSIITLEKNSKLSYPTHFAADKREVFLSGNAFFNVHKNPKKPFYVYANEVVTKVLGTSFRIQAFENEKQVLVNVKTGRVAVFKQNRIDLTDPETKGLIVLPNQQAVFSRVDESLKRRLVEEPLPVITTQQVEKLYLEDQPVIAVFKLIEQRYGIKMLYNEDLLESCIITTSLGNESLYDKLDVICKTIGASYKEIDAQIIIESQGCR